VCETTHRFKSAHLANERTIWIREPAEPAKSCNLAIFLDGDFYRERVDAVATIDDLTAASVISNTLFVFVSHESMESRWRECPCFPPFADFINREFLPWLESLYAQTRHARERALIGLSYTGLAAAYVAFRAPKNFTRVVAQSGSFWSDDLALVKQYRAATDLPSTAFFLSVGSKETQTNVRHKEDVFQPISQIEGVQSFREALLSRGIDVRYEEFDGAHEFGAWKRTLPAALTWALPPGSTEPAPHQLHNRS
jgi:enterochelin esterase-like enzyme